MMRRLLTALLTSLVATGLLGLSLVRPEDRFLASEPFLLGGIQVNEAELTHWLDRLEAEGMNTVSVTDYAHQGDWDSYNLFYDAEIEGTVREIHAAKSRGFRVVLILRVALDHAFPANEFLWHGMIQPADEEQLAIWFERYTAFTLRWAEVAERYGVDLLMIGSELNALTSTVPIDELPPLEEYYLNEEKRRRSKERVLAHAGGDGEASLQSPGDASYGSLEELLEARIASERAWASQTASDLEAINARRRLLERYWVELIAKVRRVYSGPLGYAANFDQYEAVGFWEHLDVMGINAYFQLRRTLRPEASVEELYDPLVAGWRRVLGDIAALRRARGLGGMPVVFTEMGYTYRANSTLEPWAADGFSLIPVGDEEGRTHPDGQPPRRMVVWQEQPERPMERALAVRALWQAHRELEEPLLAGILYWKLSTEPAHRRVEPFVLLIDEASEDPLLAELRRFTDRSP